MRIARVSIPDFPTPVYGVIHEEKVAIIKGLPFGELEPTGVVLDLAAVRLLAPVLPSKVVCVGKNYADHAAELGGEVPAEPVIFIKPSTAVIGPGDSIVMPEQTREMHHEAELAVVISQVCRDVTPERAGEVILGFTCANDVTARDLQNSDGQWTRAKSFDTFCPLGPWIETELDSGALDIECDVNGDLRQSGNTRDLVRGVHEMVSWISRVMTLLPGDVILTGTPAGVGRIDPGDSVAVTIDGIGTLTNPVTSRL
jgi:2-keto-4-pentenoate hydratase/2-oxohepta-3-ene-1,7-dioic acid hydratase in catechol pathway